MLLVGSNHLCRHVTEQRHTACRGCSCRLQRNPRSLSQCRLSASIMHRCELQDIILYTSFIPCIHNTLSLFACFPTGFSAAKGAGPSAARSAAARLSCSAGQGAALQQLLQAHLRAAGPAAVPGQPGAVCVGQVHAQVRWRQCCCCCGGSLWQLLSALILCGSLNCTVMAVLCTRGNAGLFGRCWRALTILHGGTGGIMQTSHHAAVHTGWN